MKTYPIPKQTVYPKGIQKQLGVSIRHQNGVFFRLIYQSQDERKNLRPYVMTKNGKIVRHTTLAREMVQILMGRRLPSYIVCHHLCGNPWCVNPIHLALTHRRIHDYEALKVIPYIPEEFLFPLAPYLPDDLDDKCIFIGETIPRAWDPNTCVRGDIPEVRRIRSFDEVLFNRFLELRQDVETGIASLKTLYNLAA